MGNKILKRRHGSGFINYPKEFEKRIIDGTARHRTKCDMLVGPCACGRVHQENDTWVQKALQAYHVELEPLILRPDENGTVQYPRYWAHSPEHKYCTVLSGRCKCGQWHTANEQWVLDLLQQHNVILQDCSELLSPPIRKVSFDYSILNDKNGAIIGCDCEGCSHRRNDHHEQMNRRNI
jgi:hypothetical protein